MNLVLALNASSFFHQMTGKRKSLKNQMSFGANEL